MSRERSADAVALLKTLVERDPGNAYGHYLLAAEHMQLGMVDKAEEGFRRAVAQAPDLPIARFQLGQLYLVKGDMASARTAFAPLAALPSDVALACYAKALLALADGDEAAAADALRSGLACPQDIPALAGDMRQLLANLSTKQEAGSVPASGDEAASVAPLYLSAYGKAGS